MIYPFLPALEGFLLGGGLIVAIGAQNALILRQGLLKQHVFVLCLVASVADAALIVAGVLGVGLLVQQNENLLTIICLLGALFLAVYSVLAARRVMRPSAMDVELERVQPLMPVLTTLLAFTFLNPHVYLDTVVLVGGISGQYHGDAKWSFMVGAMVASCTWFFSLGYGARILTPLFAKPFAWRILDAIIAIVMMAISISLVIRVFD